MGQHAAAPPMRMHAPPPPPTLPPGRCARAHTGEEKAAFGWLKLWMLSIIAGCYVCFGFTVCLQVGGNIGA